MCTKFLKCLLPEGKAQFSFSWMWVGCNSLVARIQCVKGKTDSVEKPGRYNLKQMIKVKLTSDSACLSQVPVTDCHEKGISSLWYFYPRRPISPILSWENIRYAPIERHSTKHLTHSLYNSQSHAKQENTQKIP